MILLQFLTFGDFNTDDIWMASFRFTKEHILLKQIRS